MSGFLLDTNVISELRKGDRGDRGVKRWIETQTSDDFGYPSLLSVNCSAESNSSDVAIRSAQQHLTNGSTA